MLETERLILRKWEPTDFEAFATMSADPDVMRFLKPGRPMTRAEAWRTFCFQFGHWHLRGFGMFAVAERATGDLVGRIGPWQPEGWPDFEVGWTLHRRYWGRGYATEAVRACIRYSFDTLGRDHLISIIDPENVRSIHVAERVGEQLEGETTLPGFEGKRFLKYGVYRSST